jgi:hypothetical protein
MARLSRKAPKNSAKASYRRRLRMSSCRGKLAYACVSKPECKYTKGRKRKYCRKKKNQSRRR